MGGNLEHAPGSERIPSLGGIYREAPFLSTLMLGGLLASLGLPGLAGFVGEFSILVGSFQTIGYWIFLLVFGMLITASYHIWAAQRAPASIIVVGYGATS